MHELVIRDRLLLAFADLRSFGIVAEPSVTGSITEATAFMQTEAAHRAPYAAYPAESRRLAAGSAAGVVERLLDLRRR